MIERKMSMFEVTTEEVSKVLNDLKETGLIFRYNFSQISKTLLKEFLPVDPFAVDFTALTEAYLQNIDFENMRNTQDENGPFKNFFNEEKAAIGNAVRNEADFHRYICKSYFGLIKEPKEELLAAFVQSRQDIKAIDETLRDIGTEMIGINTRNNSSEIQERRPVLQYYKEQNEAAKQEILSFIKEGIHQYALNNSYDNSFLGDLMRGFPYTYIWNPKAYKPHYPNDLENKFLDLTLSQRSDILAKYKEDKPAFDAFLTSYISDREVILSIAAAAEVHHVLNVRKEIITATLKSYETGGKIMFSIAVPSIIEGILHDLCLLVGEKENDLLGEGFQYKLNQLNKYLRWELFYEYYSFRFRLFRNKVSHGRMTKADVDELADLLLLDLQQICRLVQSDKFDVNHKRFVIHELNKKLAKPDFKYLMQYLLLDKTEIPSFYGLEKEIEEVEKLIIGESFWNFLETEMETGGEPVKHGIYTVVKIISSRRPFDKRCTKIFKKAAIEKVDRELADDYLKYLTRDF